MTKNMTQHQKVVFGHNVLGVGNLILIVKFHRKLTDITISTYKTYLLKHVRTYFLLSLF